MRGYTYIEVWENFLKEMYKNPVSMTQTFLAAERVDKAREFENKNYVKKTKFNKRVVLYLQKDINAYLSFQQEKFNTIIYAKQLLLDLELLYEKTNKQAYMDIIAKITGIIPKKVYYHDFDYKTACRIIENIKQLFTKVDIETIKLLKQELRLIYEES